MKKVLMILSVLLLSLTTVFAAQQMSVTWEWLLDDPEVNYYRYQLNGTDDDGWTVVSGDTATYVAEGLDPYADYTLYLQRSYDGINWSETASATAEALLVAEEPAAVEEVVVEEVPAAAEEVPAVEEAAPVEPAAEETVVEEVAVEEPAAVEEAVVEEVVEEVPAAEEAAPVEPVAPVAPAPVKESKPVEFSLLFRPYAVFNLNFGGSDVWESTGIGLGLSFDIDDVVAFNDNSGLGVRIDVGSTQYPGGGFAKLLKPDGAPLWQFWNWKWGDLFNFVNNYSNDVNLTALATIDARAGIMDFSIGLGGGAAVLFSDRTGNVPGVYHFNLATDIDLAAYAAAEIGLKFYCGDVFSIGIDGVYKMMIPNIEYNSVDASLVLGVTF